jgi:hypothetical protein
MTKGSNAAMANNVNMEKMKNKYNTIDNAAHGGQSGYNTGHGINNNNYNASGHGHTII